MAKKRGWIQKLLYKRKNEKSWLRNLIAGSLYRLSDIKGESSLADISTQIDTMRALARDSQISTALSYYATDATTLNTKGQVIWATAADGKSKEVEEIIAELFKRWKVNSYARDHILELATVGNLYVPTSIMFKDDSTSASTKMVAIDNNTIPDKDFDIVPSYKIPPEEIVHVYQNGEPIGYIHQPEDGGVLIETLPESACIHFSLGGLLGNYTITVRDNNGDDEEFDIKFAQPLMDKAVQPTQTLNLLEDSLVLSSLIRTIKFINVECGNAEEDEVDGILQDIKDAIEQQLSLDTNAGSVDSFVNPQSPNNLIYLPKIKGADAISITDLNMSDATNEDSKLLEHYQDKKLSVLGVPKEAMNFSSNEGLGGAGSVLSQRSALYANSLQRLKTAYIEGWTEALNTYFTERGMSGLVNSFELHMSEIITTQSTITFERRDAAVAQAQAIIQLLKDLGIEDVEAYREALTEILLEVLPATSAKVNGWKMNLDKEDGGVEDAL